MLELKNCFLGDAGHDTGHELSFEVHRSESVALLAANAHNSSAVLQGILGFRPVPHGYISIEGEPLTSASAAYFRRAIAYVPTRFSRFGGSVGEFLAQYRAACAANVKDDGARQAELWAKEGLTSELLQASFADIDAAQRQLVLLLTALAVPKPLTLIDDLWCDDSPERLEQLSRLIRLLTDAGSAVLITTTDVRLAQGCTRHIALNND